ncbi:Pentatricopeptide repeat-containing protein [Actinidia chinensis var. chinensis]|uniref:Pentatricopeptide repeat-containing protein n=1 Tax=Actinidia chinensis var. chinensis TaxID=1590841 RepID=A0A2R6PY49_ACTCC|nr:Pentatricopeptide repeat-containing protein [Actinidia chinensis var. chinensis]
MSASFLQPPILSFTEKATSISEVHQAHAHLLKTGLIHHPSVARRLLFSAANTTTTTYAHAIFTRLQDPNTNVYNAMIRAYANSPTPQNAITVYTQMMNDCVVPDKYTFTSALKGCSRIRGVEEGKQVHAHVVKIGIGSDLIVGNTLVHLYAKCGYFEVAREVLDRMPQRDVISWNAILSAYVNVGLVELARGVFDEMPERNLESWNFMISGYVAVGLVEEARGVFDEMPVKDVVSWNVMITGYSQASGFGDVLVLFEEMQNANVKPDSCTLVSVLSACARLGALSQGEWVRALVKKNRIDDANGFLATALVDMYSKCGCIEKALEIFQNAFKKDVSTWNSMISGLSIHGFGEQALEIFNEMLTDGVEPNEITFINVLSACSHAGLLKEGREVFDLMIRVHRIQPSVKHYGCMVDLLGRFGLLEEAEELVKSMPMKEASVVWESLLGACRNHGNVEKAERIAGKLLELAPEDSSGYVQLSNIHASMGRWNDVNEVRTKMKTRGVSKQPGCSMIEVDGIVHEFFSLGSSAFLNSVNEWEG